MRTVITENEVSNQVAACSNRYPRIYQQFEALEWRLAHKPESGIAVGNGYFAYRQSRVLSTLPDLTVLYEYDDHRVSILFIRIIANV
jgi:hypothetical protein